MQIEKTIQDSMTWLNENEWFWILVFGAVSGLVIVVMIYNFIHGMLQRKAAGEQVLSLPAKSALSVIMLGLAGAGLWWGATLSYEHHQVLQKVDAEYVAKVDRQQRFARLYESVSKAKIDHLPRSMSVAWAADNWHKAEEAMRLPTWLGYEKSEPEQIHACVTGAFSADESQPPMVAVVTIADEADQRALLVEVDKAEDNRTPLVHMEFLIYETVNQYGKPDWQWKRKTVAIELFGSSETDAKYAAVVDRIIGIILNECS